MRTPQQNIIYVGLKFTSVHFSASAEIVAVREADNHVDVMLTSSEGHSRVEKGWNLQHTKWGFERGEYVPVDLEKDRVNYSII
jgi:hypothetical protein